MTDKTIPRRIFLVMNVVFFIIVSAVCLIPIIQVLSISLSSSSSVAAGKVILLPMELTMKSYEYILRKAEFWRAMLISGVRVMAGVSFGMLMTVLMAYPLSKPSSVFRARTLLMWLLLFTMLFSGGMIPAYMIVKYTGLTNNILSLILPCSIQAFNIILLVNFFRAIPRELEESAFLDGADHFRIMWRIYIPLSLPSIATLVVFTMVYHWNAWFDGMIYLSDAKQYPLQTYLQAVLVNPNVKLITKSTAELLRTVSDRTLKAAQVFIAAIPICLVYPFLQRYFVAGIMLGGVKE